MKKVSQVACRYVPPSPCPTYKELEGDTIIIVTKDDSALYVRLLEDAKLYELTIVDRIDCQRGYKLQFISTHPNEGLKQVIGVGDWLHVKDGRIMIGNDIYARTGETIVDPELVVCPPMRSADA